MSWSLAIYVFVIQYISFIIKGLVGFGNPLLSSPLLAMRLDNRVITPANLLLDLPVNAYMVFKNRKSFDARSTLPVAGLVLLGVVPGTFFLKSGSPWVIKAVLGVFIIGLGVEMALRPQTRKTTRVNPVLYVAIPILSGIMAGLFGISMLFLAYFERVSKNLDQFRSSICFVFLIENSFRTVLYCANGMFTPTSLALTAVAIPAALLGVATGGFIDRRMKPETARRWVTVVFILGGLSILVKALLFRT